jgi:tRNA(Arg) A34 adenosine deaminase TadA
MLEMLRLAAKIALPTTIGDARNFWVGSIGIRRDGVLVSAKNGAVTDLDDYQLIPNSHAEGRVLRKLGKHGILFVARVAKGSQLLALSAPCSMCSVRIRSLKVKKVYYSINQYQYGLWDVCRDTHRVFNTNENY